MSPTDRTFRRMHTVIAVIATVGLVVACSGKAPNTAAPSGGPAAAATPRSASGVSVPAPGTRSEDAWLVVGRSGEDGLEAIAGSTSQRLFGLPSGVPDGTWSQLVSATTTGKTTTVRDLRIPELEGVSQTIDGIWRLPTVGLDSTPVGVSDDGHTIVLVEDRAATAAGSTAIGPSRFAVVDRTAAATPRIVELAGAFEYDALSPDGSILYVVEHLAGPPDGHYQVRALDTASGLLREGAVADKNEGDEAMAGWPIAQARRPDGMVFTLYHGAEHPFIHALSSIDAWALCIDLPAAGADDPATASDWGLTATVNGRSIVAANATLGLAVEIPLADLAVRRSVTFAPSASGSISLAKFGHQAGGVVGRRIVASPLGSLVYAAGPGGIVSIGTSDLALRDRFLEGVAIEALAVTPDGGTIYALLHAGGRIVWLDAASGRIAGEVPGGGYDRLLAVVPG
jgi:hypothetical protein